MRSSATLHAKRKGSPSSPSDSVPDPYSVVSADSKRLSTDIDFASPLKLDLSPGDLGVGVRRQMKNELNFPPNFEGLVLGCIDASKQASKVVQSFSKKKEKKRRDPGMRVQLKYT